jgi:hypothetical protein
MGEYCILVLHSIARRSTGFRLNSGQLQCSLVGGLCPTHAARLYFWLAATWNSHTVRGSHESRCTARKLPFNMLRHPGAFSLARMTLLSQAKTSQMSPMSLTARQWSMCSEPIKKTPTKTKPQHRSASEWNGSAREVHRWVSDPGTGPYKRLQAME